MDQPMRRVCLCLDAHNFVAGPAPRADEISRMMHRGHVRPPSRDSPSLHASRPKFTSEIWDCGGLFDRGGAVFVAQASDRGLNAAFTDLKMKARIADFGWHGACL